MRRALPLLLVALLALVGFLIFGPGDKQVLDNDPSGVPVSAGNGEVASADSGSGGRTAEATPEAKPFTNRPVKVGFGRYGLHGTVVDEAGKAVPGAWVAAYTSPFPIVDFEQSFEEILENPLSFSLEPLSSAFADDQGQFQLAGVPGRALYLTARTFQRLSNGRQRVSPGELLTDEGVQLRTYRAASLSGKVVDDNGVAVPNAEVLIGPGLKYLVAAIRDREIFIERIYTDAAGQFEIEAVPAGMVLTAHAFRTSTHPGQKDFGPLAGSSAVKVNVSLRELGDLGGRVLDTDEQPIGGARVAAIPLDLRLVIPVVRDIPAWTATADGAGQYSFPGLPHGQYLLVAQSDYGRSAPHTGRIVGASGNVQDLVLDTRNEISGRVLDSAGEPVAGARIRLMSIPDGADSGERRSMANMNFLLEMAKEVLPELLPAETEAVTDREGRFRIAAWRQARLRLEARGFLTADYRLGGLKDEKNPVLVAQRPGGAAGVVISVGEEKPVPFYIVQSDLRRSAFGQQTFSQFSDEVMVESGSASSGVMTLEAVESDDASAAQEQGSDASAAPGPLAAVEAVLAEDEQVIAPRDNIVTEAARTRFFDNPDGTFRLSGMAPGTWQLRFRAEGYQQGRASNIVIQEGEVTEGIEVELGAGSSVSGIVVSADDGSPVSEAAVTVSRGKQDGFSLLLQGFLEGAPVTRTRADGTFTLEGLEKGGKYVHVMAEGYAMASVEIETVEDGEARAGVEVEISAGGSVTGKVTDRHGVALAQRMVVAFSPGSTDFHQSGTDESGIYLIENLRPGNYMLISASLDDESLFTGDFMSILTGGRLVPATIVESQTVTVDIVDSAAGGCHLQGRLTKNGVPVPSAMLNAVSTGGSGMLDFRMATSRTDENGNYDFKSIAPGEYSLNVDSNDWDGSLDLFVDDIAEDWVELRVPESVVSGQILAANTNMPLEGVRIRMVREDGPGGMAAMFGGGGWRRSAVSDGDGRFAIEGAVAGDYHLVVEADQFGGLRGNDPDETTANYRKTETPGFFLDEDERHDIGSLKLEAAGSVKVAVSGADGKPFPEGFSIMALADAEAPPSEMDFESGNRSWGRNGEGTLSGLPEGSWRIRVEARGYAPSEERVMIRSGQTAKASMQLLAGVDLRVRVLGSNGQADNDAVVSVYNMEGALLKQDGGDRAMLQRFFGNGGGGERQLGSFAPGRYRVVATSGSRDSETTTTLQAGQGSIVELRL